MTLILLVLAAALLAEGFFSGMETGLVSIRRPRVENAASRGDRKAGILLFFLDHPGVMISTVLIAVNISTVAASLAAKALAEKLGVRSPAGYACVTALLSLALLMSEIIPKSWFRQDGYRRCGRMIGFFRICYLVLYVPAHLFSWFTRQMEKLIPRRSAGEDREKIRENLKLFLRESESGGVMFSETTDMLDRAIDLRNRTLEVVMIPRKQIPELKRNDSLRQAMDLCGKSGLPCLPAAESSGQWTGAFFPEDAVFNREEADWDRQTAGTLLRPYLEAGEKEGLVTVFAKLKNSPASVIFVRDGKGGFSGMVTMERLAAELFGN